MADISDDALADMIDRYCAAWGEDDASRRLIMLREVFAEQGTYTDPLAHVEGLENLVNHIGTMRRQFPAATIVRTSAIDRHHHCARFGWKLVQGGGEALPEGIDIVAFHAGKLQSVTGFFGPLKPR